MVQLTILHGEQVAMLDIGLDMALLDFIALCQLELEELASVPAARLRIVCNGRNIHPTNQNLSETIQALGFGENDAVYIEAMPPPASQANTTVPSSSSHGQRSNQQAVSVDSGGAASSALAGDLSGLISKMVKGIKTPAQLKTQDKDHAREMFNSLTAEPLRLGDLRHNHPPLADAFEKDPKNFENFCAAYVAYRTDRERLIRLAATDPHNEEGQRFIAEQIARENIDKNHHLAMELTPEAFIKVHMLYIRMKINNHTVIAFVDSGAQVSILSESCARRCEIWRLVDQRYAGKAVGVGGEGRILGRVHSCEVQIESSVFPCNFSVMADRNVDILFGLDILRRHRVQIDLKRHVLCFGDGTETPFLNEVEYQRELENLGQNASAFSTGM